MRTLSLISALFVLLGATSCKKEYTCDCTVNGASTVGNINKDATEAEAKAACQTAEDQYRGIDPAATCTLTEVK